jgi:hypothetical protein
MVKGDLKGAVRREGDWGDRTRRNGREDTERGRRGERIKRI